MLKKSASGILASLRGTVKRETMVSRGAAALLGTRRVSARRGWAGEKAGLFDHPARHSPTVLEMEKFEVTSCHNSFSVDSKRLVSCQPQLLENFLSGSQSADKPLEFSLVIEG